MENDIHTGGCMCGSLRYETRGAPSKTAVCHCRYCQLMTGSAFGVSTYFNQENVSFSGPNPKEFTFTTESGREFTARFCETCGTRLTWTLEALPGLVGIAGGSFDPPSFWYEISREIFTRSKAPFVNLELSEHMDTTASYAPCRDETGPRNGG